MNDPTRRTRVLVAEDDGDLSELLVDLLVRDGHEVELVRSAERLFEKLTEKDEAGRFDVVLSDLRMGGPTSLDALARTDPQTRPTVVIMTGAASPEVLRVAQGMGVERVISKPFDVNALRRLVRELAVATGRRRDANGP